MIKKKTKKKKRKSPVTSVRLRSRLVVTVCRPSGGGKTSETLKIEGAALDRNHSRKQADGQNVGNIDDKIRKGRKKKKLRGLNSGLYFFFPKPTNICACFSNQKKKEEKNQ